MKVIKDTKVEIGDRARRRGIVIRLIAGVIFVCACAMAMAMMMWLLITSVGKSSEADRPAESAVLDAASK